jgi:hypothetical protein
MITIEEQERMAYMAGDTEKAALLSRIDRRRAGGRARAENIHTLSILTKKRCLVRS